MDALSDHIVIEAQMAPTLNLLAWLDAKDATGHGDDQVDLETFVDAHTQCGSEMTPTEFTKYGELLISEWIRIVSEHDEDQRHEEMREADALREQIEWQRTGRVAVLGCVGGSDDESTFE